MDYLARKISRAKWEPVGDDVKVTPASVSADAIGASLRTIGNRLSVWECDNEPDDVAEVVLALACPPGVRRLDDLVVETMDVVLIPKQELNAAGFRFEFTDGDTSVDDLRGRHIDVEIPNLAKLSDFALLVAAAYRDPQRGLYRRFTAAQVRRTVDAAAAAGRIRLVPGVES